MMNIAIVFREGLSGHYLKKLILDEPTVMGFRVDDWYPGIYNELTLDYQISNIKIFHQNYNPEHLKSFDKVFTILVDQAYYHAAYNFFHKKILVEQYTQEQFNNWRTDCVHWYDKVYYTLHELMPLYKQDTQVGDVVLFDRLLDSQYLTKFFIRHFNKELSENQQRMIQDYTQHQVSIPMPLTGNTMAEIIAGIPAEEFIKSPWWAMYAVYKYEVNNKLTEKNRTWSINNFTSPITATDLLDIATCYSDLILFNS